MMSGEMRCTCGCDRAATHVVTQPYGDGEITTGACADYVRLLAGRYIRAEALVPEEQ